MARKKRTTKRISVETYRHESAKRKNIPTAKIAAEGTVPRVAKAKYAYSAHLPPELVFDATGQSDRVIEIVEKAAAGKKLAKEEADILRGLAENASLPWLEWTGKKEKHERGLLEVEPVALHIHERVSTSAITRAAKREDVQADLFADPELEYKDAIQFYKHDVDWANRLILGDCLEVMSSLASREGLAGKVQMVFIDPPYGIKFASNFMPEVSTKPEGNRDKESDLTREVEMVRAFRDTWSLGVHTYLSYLRDRLIVVKTLLSDKGSLFVQIGDENVHRVRLVMDEVFGPENFLAQIAFTKTSGMQSKKRLTSRFDHLLWYAKNRDLVKIISVHDDQVDPASAGFTQVEEINGNRRNLNETELAGVLEDGCRVCKSEDLTKSGPGAKYEIEVFGRTYTSKRRWWGMPKESLQRLVKTGRVFATDTTLRFCRYLDESPGKRLTNLWDGIGGASDPKYVVQTSEEVLRRCIFLATDPGDLVIDPTCGGGTTAYVAEGLGRRWITIDSSRVAISIARQRILTAKYSYFELMGESPADGFVLKKKPLITPSVVSNNQHLDQIITDYEQHLAELMHACNKVISQVSDETRKNLAKKLASKEAEYGKKAITDEDRRLWLLPTKFDELNLPFGVDPDWPSDLKNVVEKYRACWRERRDKINECIAKNSSYEELVDKPIEVHGVLRVSGPFTVEGVRPEELSLDQNGELFDPTPNEGEVHDGQIEYAQNASAYIDRMLQLINQDGVTFPNNEHRQFAFVERLEQSDSVLHAEALWEGAADGDLPNVAIAFGPQHGPVTASHVEDLIRASRRYDELVIAAFSFDGSSQAVIQESANPRLRIHMAHIRPDVSPGMEGLLKDSPKSQLFTVFGQPEIAVWKKNGEVKVELLGVDIYSPLTGEITSSGANKVAAWFLDSDYDGRCFCITQAFFPDQNAWDKIAKALGSLADAEAFDAFNGTVSVPFKAGEHNRIAVKVIDPRGNEVMAIRSLGENG